MRILLIGMMAATFVLGMGFLSFMFLAFFMISVLILNITKIFNFFPGSFGFHEVWHIFVLLAAVAHFVAVLGVAS